jgi:hypothetical protein
MQESKDRIEYEWLALRCQTRDRGAFEDLIYHNQVATLKEIKQVQLQILELQASLRKHE